MASVGREHTTDWVDSANLLAGNTRAKAVYGCVVALSAQPFLTPGERIGRLCNVKGISPEEFAQRLGVDYSTAARYMRSGTPPAKRLRQIAMLLQVPQGFLLGDQSPDWIDRTVEQVASFESLKRYLDRLEGEPRRRAEKYRRGVDLPAAPKTIEQWEQLDAFLRAISGGKP